MTDEAAKTKDCRLSTSSVPQAEPCPSSLWLRLQPSPAFLVLQPSIDPAFLPKAAKLKPTVDCTSDANSVQNLVGFRVYLHIQE